MLFGGVVGVVVVVVVLWLCSVVVVVVGVVVVVEDVVVVLGTVGLQQVPAPSVSFVIHTQMVRVTFPSKLLAVHVYSPLCARCTFFMLHRAVVR